MFWTGLFLFLILTYIGFDYGRLIVKNRRLQRLCEKESIDFTPYTPTKYIMIGAKGSKYIQDLAQMDIEAHAKAEIGIKSALQLDGKVITCFDNGDQLLVIDYEQGEVEALSPFERDNYEIKLFFDHKLPEGAERTIIKQLGLLDYMINIGICSEKSGGK